MFAISAKRLFGISVKNFGFFVLASHIFTKKYLEVKIGWYMAYYCDSLLIFINNVRSDLVE